MIEHAPVTSMADELGNVAIEHLRHIRRSVDENRERLGDLQHRVTSAEGQVAQLHLGVGHLRADFAGQSARLDRIEFRLDRIVQRLELSPAPSS